MFLLKPKNIIKISYHALLVFSIIFILLINSFPWFLNISYLQNRLFHIITNQTQLDFNSKDIDFDPFPTPALKLKNLTIKSKDDIEYSCQTILLYPDLTQLIKRKLVLNKISIFNSNLIFIPIKPSSSKTFNLNNLFQNSQIEQYINQEKGLLILINNFKHDFAEKLDVKIKILDTKNIVGDISITDFALKKEFLKKYGFNKKFLNLYSKKQKGLIFIKSLKASFNITDLKTQFKATPIIFKYPSMTLDVNFSYNNKTEKAFIEFFGKNVNIKQAKTAYFDLFNKEEVSENLFDIVRAGNASKISVIFNENKLKNLFRPENMVLSGQLEEGDIRIPNTPLVPNKVYGTAKIKNGILYIKTEKGRLHNAKINYGTLEIDLLNHRDYPFHGTFGINSPLLDVKNILIELFDDTLLAQELKLVSNVNGNVQGELKLALKTGKDLDVIVITEDIQGSGKYLRTPGNIKVNMGKFTYKNEIVTLTDFAGKIGESYYYDFTGSYFLNNTNFIDIKSGEAVVDSSEVFNWLFEFEPILKKVQTVKIENGYVKIDSINIKGDIFNLEKLQFDTKGYLKNNRFKQKLNKNANLLKSCDFNISNQGLSFKKINAEVSDIDLISNFTLNKEIKNFSTPFTLKNATYKSTKNSDSFTGDLEFPNGPKIKLYSKNNNKKEFYLKNLEIKDGQETNVNFLTDDQKNIDFFTFKGQINTRTLEKIFKQNSPFYNKLIAYTDKKEVIIKSKKGTLITILADALNLEQILNQIFTKTNDGLFTKEPNSNNFPEKRIKIKTNLLTYKESHFNNFITDLLIKKEKNKFQGKLDITSEQGKIHSLTLISRILSAINISNYFKDGGPDFNQTGFKYKSIKVKSVIKNNVIILKEAVIDGQDMTLVFKGTIDIEKDDLNLTCLVAPFKTIDLLIEKIPVVNTMLNNTLISIPVKVSGKIADPTVFPLHPTSVGKGIINLFANIIKAPFKLFEAIPSQTTSNNKTSEEATYKDSGP